MAGKRTKTRKEIKLNKKLVCTIGVLLLIIGVISAIIMIFKPVNVGKINKEGKAEYIERVANVTKYPDKKIVEFKNNYELIDNGIITTGRTAEKRRTQGQASSELFEAESQRRTETVFDIQEKKKATDKSIEKAKEPSTAESEEKSYEQQTLFPSTNMY